MTEQPGSQFAGLLRHLRTEARLTQEELAEAAGLSPRSVSDLERGINRTARKETAGLLAGALGVAGPARELFVAAARGRAPVADVLAAVQEAAPGAAPAAASRTLPRDTASFTGRERELARLLEELAPAAVGRRVVGIHALDGMAGIGKTTLAVHAAHRLATATSARRPPTCVRRWRFTSASASRRPGASSKRSTTTTWHPIRPSSLESPVMTRSPGHEAGTPRVLGWVAADYSVAIAVSMSRRAARRAGPMLASTPAAAVARM